jgi:uncharacterized protein YcfJ
MLCVPTQVTKRHFVNRKTSTVVFAVSDNERINMKMNIAAFSAVLFALAAPAFASDYGVNDYTDSARVVSSVPIYQTISQPQQQCWTESVTSYEEQRSPGGLIVGGLTGGLLGNAIGRGRGRPASTVVGAIIGAAVGDHIANRDRNVLLVSRPIQHCQTVESVHQVLTGYQVTYDYNGRYSTVMLPYNPGARVPLEITVGNSGLPAYLGPPVGHVAYEYRHGPVWQLPVYKRPRHHDRSDH